MLTSNAANEKLLSESPDSDNVLNRIDTLWFGNCDERRRQH